MALPGVVVFIIIVLVIALLSFVGWIIFTHLRARRLGLPTPALSSYNPFANSSSAGYGGGSSSGGVANWIKDKFSALRGKGNRSATGGYEEPLGSFGQGRAARRGFGPLDPDDAWDARVGTEADAYGPGGYYEEAELGLHGDTGYAGNVHADAQGRGRVRPSDPEPYIGGSQRGLDARYDEEMGSKGKGKAVANPFDDDAEISLRGVSPRPVTEDPKKPQRVDTERRSLFREDV